MEAILEQLKAGIGFNFKVVIVQIAVFLFLLWILNKYLFGKVGEALRNRRETIEKSFKDIEEKQRQANERLRELDLRLAKIEEESRQRLSEAVNEGKKMAEQIRKQAQEQAEEEIERSRKEIQYQKEQAIIEVRRLVADLTIGATERVLQRTVDAGVQRALVEQYLADLDRVMKQ